MLANENIFLQKVSTVSDIEILLLIIIHTFSFQMTENVLPTLFLLQTFFLSVDLIGPRKSILTCSLFSSSFSYNRNYF